MERTLSRNEQEFKNLKVVASLLESHSPNNAEYIVEDVYLDHSQNWMWTTIVRRGYRECQVLSPRDWENITEAATIGDLMDAYKAIIEGKYFGDK